MKVYFREKQSKSFNYIALTKAKELFFFNDWKEKIFYKKWEKGGTKNY